MTLKKAFIATTALILCVSTSFAAQQTARFGESGRGVTPSDLDKHNPNGRFLSWFGYSPASGDAARRNGGGILYEQSASSGFSTYAISSWHISGSAACASCHQTMAADDFVIPGTGGYEISAVYAPGHTISGTEPSSILITFYDVLKYSRQTGKTIIVTKTTCDTKSFSDTNGHGNFMVDVSSCKLGTFKGGHDYSVSVQPWFWSNGRWAWHTNRKQIRRQAFYVDDSESGPCNAYFRPVKICFPEKGYGPDLAFAIYGRKR